MVDDGGAGRVDHGTLELADGRRLDHAGIGAPDAPTVVYCHGTPGSRWEVRLARDALRHTTTPIRLVALNRPGYGTSTWVDRPGFRPWAGDVAEALDRLGVGQVGVLGASGGAPFALACAAELADRVSRVVLVAGVAPPDVPGMEDAAAIAHESRSATVRRVRYGALALAVRAGLADRVTRQVVAALGPADQAALRPPEAMAVLTQVVREGFAQHGRAATHEAGLFQRPWDLDLARVGQPTRVWHGTRDTRIPARVAEGLARRLPSATAATWPGHGHFSWAASDRVADVSAFLATGSGVAPRRG